MNKALEGLKVIELGHAVAIPFCGVMLADFGAEVIKVEPPKRGDILRGMGNFQDMWFAVEGRNKKCITLDLRSDKGKEIFSKLLQDADVFLENYRPGALERLGFDWESVHKLNPRLIMVSGSGYGQTGPYANKPGFDRLGLGLGGLTYITGFPESAPLRPGLAVADYLTGLFSLFGAMAAVYYRDNVGSGVGQHIDISLYESVLRIMEASLADYSYKGIVRERMGNAHLATIPGGHYLTKDGKYLVLAVAGEKVFSLFAKAIGREDMITDEKFSTASVRNINRQEIEDVTSKWISEHTLRECLDIFGDDVPSGPVYSVEDMFNDPHFAFRENIVKVDTEKFGEISMQGIVPKMSETPGEIRWAGPSVGAFNDEVYGQRLHMTKEDLEELRKEGVI